MELKELCEKVCEIFEVESIKDLRNAIEKCILFNFTEKYSLFCDCVENLSIDWLQKIFQYYEADREEKKQDYTPKSICKLCAELTKTDGKVVYDICAGSGAMTIQKWVQDKNKTFICEELDENVLPFLQFNMAVRNMNGYVIHRNVLTMELFGVYKLTAGERFSTVEKISEVPEIKADETISNPPYNIKWDAPDPLFADERFQGMPIPPKSNANFAFVYTALHRTKKSGRIAFVLPCAVASSKLEIDIRECLINSGHIEKVILLPNKMFECTNIATCIIVFSTGNDSVDMYDLREKGVEEKREQRGQFGGKAHENRVYTKTVNVIPDELIEDICNKPCEDVKSYSKKVTMVELAEKKYSLVVSQYIDISPDDFENKHRPFKDIVNNLNYIIRLRNSCKLVINETLAKSLGLDVKLYKDGKENSVEVHKALSEMVKLDLLEDDYITFTKNKNEITFKSNDKDVLSHLFGFFIQRWAQDVHLLNEMENVYLTELRDALLPDLMNGKIDLEGAAARQITSKSSVF